MALFDQSVRTTWIFDLFGPSAAEEIAEFSVWYTTQSTDRPGNMQDAVDAWAAAAYTAWSDNADDAVFRTNVKLNSVKATDTNQAGHAQWVGINQPGSPWVGTATGACLPWQDSFCVGLYTYTPGTFISDQRSRRGRIFLPPMSVAVLDIPTKGNMSDSRVTDTLTWVGAMLSQLAGTAWGDSDAEMHPSVISRITNKAPRVAPLEFVLTDLAADNVIDTQRRRTHQELKTRHSVAYTP